MWPISIAQNIPSPASPSGGQGGKTGRRGIWPCWTMTMLTTSNCQRRSSHLVGQQVADGGDRGGELGGGVRRIWGRIWRIWGIWRRRRSGLCCWWLRRWQKLWENERERRWGGKKEKEEKERYCGLCYNFLRHLGPCPNVNWAQAGIGSKSFPPLLMQS